MPRPEELLVRDDERDYYGKHYFERVAELHGQPPLDTRARFDLTERCIHWLIGLLRYCSPPARVLELGCAHGAFVALMRWAGFDATGLDLSPEVVVGARQRFDVPVLVGPVASQDIAPGSLNAIVLMDVLEHFAEPKETLRQCLQLLKPDGVIFIQTPHYREGLSFDRMEKEEDPFLRQLKPDQHLFLFSESSVRRLFRELDVAHVNFEPAIFSFYDMSLVASRVPLFPKPENVAVAPLEASSKGRLVLALCDLYVQLKDLMARYRESEADRAVRMQNILRMEKLLAEQAANYSAKLVEQATMIDHLTIRLQESEADRTERLKNNANLERLLAEQAAVYSANLAAQAETIDNLTTRLKQSEADRTERLRNNVNLEKLVAEQAAVHSTNLAAQAETIEDLTTRLKESEADRAERLRNNADLEKLLAEQAAVHSANLAAQAETIEDLTTRLKESEADRSGRLENNLSLERLLAEQAARFTANQAAQAATIDDLSARLKESEADRAQRLKNNLILEKLLAEQAAVYSSTRAAHGAEIHRLNALAEDLRLQIAARGEQLREQSASIRELVTLVESTRQTYSAKTASLAAICEDFRKETADLKQVIELQKRHLAETENLLGRVRQSHVFRLLRRVRLWGWLDATVNQPLEGPSSFLARTGNELRRVVVDLTPVLPGGGNGGAKVMTLELIRHLCRLAPNCDFILLTSEKSHDELAILDTPNVSRLCVNGPNGAPALSADNSLVRQLGADLLFCPFTAPFYFDPAVPSVCVVYDLQHAYYPEFFDLAETQERDRNLSNAIQAASKIVCISEFVRNTLLEKTKASPDRAQTIHILLSRRLGSPSASQCEGVLRKLNLVSVQYLLYPANFWPHKNHEILLTAFGIYLADNPGSEMKLVLTGFPGGRRDFLREAARRMGLSQAVFFPGYLPEDELSALFHSCTALIFPSLFEGFGMPLLEAMAAGRPILCSNTTSLPEVAGGAALQFDPRKPADIAAAISRIANDPQLRLDLAAKSSQRLAAFGGPEDMAASYLEVFRAAVRQAAGTPPGVYGVFEDGWLGERFTVAFGSGSDGRRLRVTLQLPEWVTTRVLSVRVEGPKAPQVCSLLAGEVATIECVVGSGAGFIDMFCSPSFQPRQCGLGDDARFLTCQLTLAEIVSPDGVPGAIKSIHHAA